MKIKKLTLKTNLKNPKNMKALALLKTNKTVAERAENYATSMKRNIQRDVIDTLLARKEKYEDDIGLRIKAVFSMAFIRC